MIGLGCVDSNVSDEVCAAYSKHVEALTGLPPAHVAAGNDRLMIQRLPSDAADAMDVAQVQQALKDLGFFPGGLVDGICGYRTQSAIRLFQEYVRTVEKLDCTPDGRFGPQSQEHLRRWLDGHLQTTWAPVVADWAAGMQGAAPLASEYAGWLAWLEAVKDKYVAKPSPVLQRVNDFKCDSDTRKVAQWDFSHRAGVHLIGIRREEVTGRFDDIFVLLVKGLVFKFQGTTEPGASKHKDGPPYLVPGQHDYHFGWHKSSYLALRPQGPGVLVVRAGVDKKLTEDDWAKGLEANNTINIHWGGRGLLGFVNNWSEGCQTINGSVYVNAANELVSCRDFAATTPEEARTNPKKSRGAYSVLVDLVTALGGDVGNGAVKYTLVEEADLALAPHLGQDLARWRERVVAMAS